MSIPTDLLYLIGFIAVFTLMLLSGYAAMISITALRALRQGQPIKPAIQPLLDEW